jgi:hypothetical protein
MLATIEDTAAAQLADQPLPGMPAAAAPAGAMAAPSKRPPKPEEDHAAAPHGWRYDAKAGAWVPRKPAGRPRSVPRVQTAPAAAPAAPRKAAKPAGPAVDYRQVVMDTAETVWLGLSTAPIPDKVWRYDISSIRVRARIQAEVIQRNAPGLAAGLATIAEHAPKSFIARGLQRLAKGEGALWVLPAATLILPFLVQTAAAWSQPIDGNAEAMAAQVEADGREYFSQMAQAMAANMIGAQVDAPEGGGDAAL